MRSLAGQPVDFYGSGWQAALGDIPDFRHVGRVHHDDIALLIPHYRAVLNFDPNWSGGVHDRVYTAAAMGVTVVTNTNTALHAAALPADLVIPYAADRPAIGEQLAALELFDGAPHMNAPARRRPRPPQLEPAHERLADVAPTSDGASAAAEPGQGADAQPRVSRREAATQRGAMTHRRGDAAVHRVLARSFRNYIRGDVLQGGGRVVTARASIDVKVVRRLAAYPGGA